MAIFTHRTSTIEYEYQQGPRQEIVILFHPHPLYEGTMMNKVITTSCMAVKQLGYGFLRFNFTGVGQSSGHFGFGLYESEQAMAIMTSLIHEPIKYFIGFSFGCNVIQYVWKQQEKKTPTLWIGASINQDFSTNAEFDTVKAMIHGKEDKLCLYCDALNFSKEKNIPLFGIDDADHFFNGQQIALREKVKEVII